MKVIIENQEILLKELQNFKKDLDIVKIEENHWHILYQNQSFTIKLIAKNLEEKTAEWKINGKSVISKYQSELDVLLQSMGLSSQNQKKVRELKSPMPGLIKKVHIKVGDEIKKGEPLLVLEAMKMENILKAPVDVKVSQIKVVEGNTVEKNQILVVFE